MKVVCVLAGLVGLANAGSFKALVDEEIVAVPSSEMQFTTLELIEPALLGAASHYGDPADGCEEDEVAVRIQGVSGAICSPKCTSGSCPTDVPDGCAATPQCLLQDAASGNKYCALACRHGTKCGPGASCQIIFPGIGLCTYS